MTKYQQDRINKYIGAHYDRINLTVPKGRKAAIQAYALKHNESVNSLINRLIDAEMSKFKLNDLPDLQLLDNFSRVEGTDDEEERIVLPWDEESPKHNCTKV